MPDKVYFKTKTISWVDALGNYHMNRILLQANNGPCFIISFTNTLILSSELNELDEWTTVSSSSNLHNKSASSLPPPHSAVSLKSSDLTSLKELLISTTVSSDSLLYELTILLLSINDRKLDPIDIGPILSTLPFLTAGLNVSLKLDNQVVDDFNELTDPINQLLQLFNIKMIHGLIDYDLVKYENVQTVDECQDYLISILENYESKIPDLPSKSISDVENLNLPQDDEAKLFRYVKIKNFLQNNMTQLSQLGLANIIEDDRLLRTNSTCIFFRNDHFNTLYKFNGNIHLLVNDIGFANEDEIVWEEVSSITGTENRFLNGYFETPKLKSPPKTQEEHNQQTTTAPTGATTTADDADKHIDYDDYILDPEDPFNQSNTGSSADAILAKQLQEEEDENYSRALQKQLNSNERQKRKKKSKKGGDHTAETSETPVAQPDSKSYNKASSGSKKDNGCVIV